MLLNGISCALVSYNNLGRGDAESIGRTIVQIGFDPHPVKGRQNYYQSYGTQRRFDPRPREGATAS